MRSMKTFAFAALSFAFVAANAIACGASGNPVDGNSAGTGTGVGDSGASTTTTDSGYGAGSDSGSTSTVTDSGTGSTPIDSGTGTTPIDSGVVFTGGGTCDITDGTTIAIEEIATFVLENSPSSCGSGSPCDSSHCCLDVAAASGGGSLPLGGPTGICLTSIDLSGLGL